MILDTSFLIDVMEGARSALAKVDEIEGDDMEQFVPAVTLQELYIGMGASEIPERECRKIQTVVETRPIFPTSKAIARKAGRIDGQLRRDGWRINVGDATIGATGIVRDEPVLTGDPDHFERIPGLDVVSY